MLSLRDLEAFGTPFRVFSDLIVAEDLVRPAPIVTGPANIAGHSHRTTYGLVITAIHYHVIADATNEGFTLNVIDETITNGSPITNKLWDVNLPVANTFATLSMRVFWPLAPSEYDTTPVNGAKIAVALRGTPAAGSSLVIEGFHTTHDWGNKTYTGSPVLFSS